MKELGIAAARKFYERKGWQVEKVRGEYISLVVVDDEDTQHFVLVDAVTGSDFGDEPDHADLRRDYERDMLGIILAPERERKGSFTIQFDHVTALIIDPASAMLRVHSDIFGGKD